MIKCSYSLRLFILFFVSLSVGSGCLAEESASASSVSQSEKHVVIVPIEDAIGNANYYVLRRSVKDAIRNQADVLILEINTPGGRVDKMLEMVDAILEFPGLTIAYVNDEAMSAGAFISMAADEIWFAPRAVIGAAEVVGGNGEDINESMKRKIESYLNGKMRAIVEDYPYRADIMRAMSDPNFEFKIGDEVLCKEGELLTLTYTEAMKEYGDPPVPLLGSGIAEDTADLLKQRFGADNYKLELNRVSWSENLAKFMEKIAPILLTLGFLGLLIEFKTPGFGLFGISGLALLLLVFLSNYVAGLAGYEPVLFLLLGVLLLLLEIFLAPGVMILAGLGLIFLFGSVVWSLADIWPSTDDGGIVIPGIDVFISPLLQVLGSLFAAIILLALLLRYLPKSLFWDKLVLSTTSAEVDSVVAGGASSIGGKPDALPEVGSHGVAVTDLHPGGTVEISGKQFEAQVQLEDLKTGTLIVVTGYKHFYLLVEKAEL